VPRTGYYSIEGFWPGERSPIEFYVAQQKVDYLQRCGQSSVYYGLHSAIEVLKAPGAIFEGLQREGQGRSYCFSGVPRRYSEDTEMPPPPGMVFVVYMTSNRVIFEWRWERQAPAAHGRPVGFDCGRYGKVLWESQ